MTHVLILFRHGLGDAVQLTVVLRHLALERPEWSIDVQAQPGKESAFFGLCARAFCHDLERRQHYDHVFNLDWHEPAGSYGPNAPATKAERCLREVFRIAPQPNLCHYAVAIDAVARARAEDYARSIASRRDDCRYRAVLIHYEGNTATTAKDLSHDDIAEVCRLVLRAGCTPVVLDWDNRSPLPRDLPGVVCPDAQHSLWNDRGIGDAATITALASVCTLCIGIDSGPQKCFGASGTPTIAVWRGHHPINYFGLNTSVRHLLPRDHERLIYGGATDRVQSLRTFSDAYNFTTYSDPFRDALFREVESALGLPGRNEQTLVAYTFCSAHRKSHGTPLLAADHWQMLAVAMNAWNPGGELPELVSAVGPLTEPIPAGIAERAAIVASAVDPGHQGGAWLAIHQAAIYARHHGFERLIVLSDDVLPFSASAMDLSRRLDEFDYTGSLWEKSPELNTQVFAARVECLFDGGSFRLAPGSFPCLEERMAAVMAGRSLRLDHHPGRDYFHTHRHEKLTHDAAIDRAAKFALTEQMLLSQRWFYARIGHDGRPMHFEFDGVRRWISGGAGGNERVWRLDWDDATDEWRLRIAGDNGVICLLHLAPGPRWTGRWLKFERMPIVLSPMPKCEGSGPTASPPADLEALYARLCCEPSDINEHLPALRRLAGGCRHIVEMGTREGRSTCALLAAQPDRLVSIDILDCHNDALLRLAGRTQLHFQRTDSREVEIEPADLLFIDTRHTFEQLVTELARHAGHIRRLLVFHDTHTFGQIDEGGGGKGLRPALDEFLAKCPDWFVAEDYRHNNGLTVLMRAPAS